MYRGGVDLNEKELATLRRITISKKEQLVLELILKGQGDKEISVLMNISTSAVKHHIRHLFAKFGCSTRTQLAIVAVRRNMLNDCEC